MILKLTIEINIDENIYGNTEEDKMYMENEVLIGDGSLTIHSSDIGDIVGEVKKVTNIQWITQKLKLKK